jgi:hypothetical protein
VFEKRGKLMKLVYICSPLRGEIERNISRANAYCRFAAQQSVVPIAPHVMFTGFLDDNLTAERSTGLKLGLELLKKCDELWVFGNRLSEGMESEIRAAITLGIPFYFYNDKCERMEEENEVMA